MENVTPLSNQPTKTVYSIGGLGNQLFVWAFARWLARETKSRVILSSAFLAQNSGQHDSFATQLPSTSVGLDYKSSTARALIARVGMRLARWGNNRDREYSRSQVMRVTRFLEVGNVRGYQFGLDSSNHQYVGYFQTYRFFADIGLGGDEVLAGIEIPDVATSDESIAIHIRHGDYRQHGDLFGVLPFEYYAKAIRQQIAHAPVTRVKVFGLFDQESMELIESLMALFSNVQFDLECLSNPQPAHVELKMLAQFNRQVISNSSYAWWACMLAPGGYKVAPQSWFRGMPEPKDLIPDGWNRITFDWQ